MFGLTLGSPVSTRAIRATPSPPPRVSDLQAKSYYAGLPSQPTLIARTGSPWEAPTGPEAYSRLRELSVVGYHEISDVWEDDLALRVHAILDEKGVDWSSTDVVRIGYVDEPSVRGNVILWIGVKPGSLSYEVGIAAALQCKMLLLDHAIDDVEVEIRQSEIVQAAGPQLLQPADDRYDIDPTVDIREPFTATLGIPICARSTPWVEGTAGFFLDKGGDGKGLLLATARHVLFPESDNNIYERKSEGQPHCDHDVLVLSKASFQRHLLSIKDQINTQHFVMDYQMRRMKVAAGREGDRAIAEREDAHKMVKKAEGKVMAFADFHRELLTHWAADTSRILGQVIFSPPIAVGTGTEQYTQDVAVIDIDASKIDPSSFAGNVIDLGTKYPPEVLIPMMNLSFEDIDNFDFPMIDRLLRLRGTIADDEMRRPTTYDKNGDPCIMVLKRGRTTGLTVGRGNNVFSYTRKYFGDHSAVSKEWAILPFSNKSGAFSAQGDSGSVVVDGAGRMGGLLTGGGGTTGTGATDVTYVTPIDFVLKTIRSNKSLAEAYPKSGASA